MNRAVWTSESFVLAAGSVLFRRAPETHDLQICILHNRKTGTWCLPKGRKDRGESLEATAVRETFEETGYRCELLPCCMPTRAPAPDTPQKGSVVVDDAVEAFAIMMRPIRGSNTNAVKFISWFLTRLKAGSADKVSGTQTAWEDYESVFLEVDVAVQRLNLPDDAQVARKAIQLVTEALERKAVEL